MQKQVKPQPTRGGKKRVSEVMWMAVRKSPHKRGDPAPADFLPWGWSTASRANVDARMAAESWRKGEYQVVRVRITELPPRKRAGR